ncbi:unnamed protein product [Didymodactylos carnosus]|uniref:Gamma-tubulin complex component n=1 Tax=Didymodactylos carnosus TaxID=1234261 RepID=A0A813RSL8_9BILA|nr:unnamed protein product [Didymodactylos carnosus]CAF0818495.1 unnamed protein product [Didymodactylos carnosus]CAF3570863.1 unnamed protein product [Didymodactylos carnosus]CAF3602647.1 unnamed protein product [Didymodactylos carnosus]
MALHEALLALQTGCSGLLTLKQDDPYFKKRVQSLPYVHPGELEQLDRLTQLGKHYKMLEDFVQNNLVSNESGLYLLSFSFELRTILQEYLSCLSKLEYECLQDTSLTLSHIVTSLDDYLTLLPALVRLIDSLHSTQFRGCQILDLIYRCTFDGNICLSLKMKQLLKACHKILFKQITTLIINGTLYDAYNEFFIGINTKPNIEAMGTTKTLSSTLTSAVNSTATSANISRSQSPETTIDSKQQTDIFQIVQPSRVTPSVYSQYQLIPNMLPSYIPLQLAEKIIFIGESWLLLKNNDQNSDDLLTTIETYFKSDTIDYNQQNKFVLEQFKKLASEDFNLFELERIVEESRLQLSLILRYLFVEKFHLCKELDQIKTYYLIGRGELYTLFINRANTTLLNLKKVNRSTENDINELFKQCINDLQLDTVLSPENFQLKFTFKDDATTQQDASLNRRLLFSKELPQDTVPFDFWSCGWSNLMIKYNIKYPLKAFFSENSKQRYNDIFQLLLVLRYVQIELNSIWLLMKTNHNIGHISQLRNLMSFFINNLQYYIQIDVLEHKYQQLIKSIQSSKDFQHIKHLHELFLNDIQTDCFMLMPATYKSIKQILTLCMSFCLFIKHFEQEKEKMTNIMVETTIEQLGKDFNSETRLLFGMLGAVQKRNALPQLAQFLARLDFNRYLTDNNGSFGQF